MGGGEGGGGRRTLTDLQHTQTTSFLFAVDCSTSRGRAERREEGGKEGERRERRGRRWRRREEGGKG